MERNQKPKFMCRARFASRQEFMAAQNHIPFLTQSSTTNECGEGKENKNHLQNFKWKQSPNALIDVHVCQIPNINGRKINVEISG